MYNEMYSLLTKACILVTLTLLLARTGLFRRLLFPKLPIRDQAAALITFLVMAIAEETISHPSPLMNARIVAVCAAGLLAGPWVGGIVGVAVTGLACWYNPQFTPWAIAVSMVVAGLAGGWIRQWRPSLAIKPSSGFAIGAAISLLRYGLMEAGMLVAGSRGSAQPFPVELEAAVMHGFGVALILVVIGQARELESRARAVAMSEVSALRSRMDPHFVFNSLNTISSISVVEPSAVPEAAERLALFMRASMDQHERALIELSEELEVVDAYLDVEKLRLGDRLKLEQKIDPRLLDAWVPPFLLQPLVENAIRHGIQPSPQGGVVKIVATKDGRWLMITVEDSGVGLPDEASGSIFSAEDGRSHALSILQRRLQIMYGRAFSLSVKPGSEAGTMASVRIPYGREVRDWIAS